MVYIRNIVIFMVFTEVLLNVVPKNDYRRYLRLYMGIIVVILVLKPLNGIFDMDYIIDSLYVRYDYKSETDSLKNELEILKGEDGIYLEAAKEGIRRIIAMEGCRLEKCEFISSTEYGEKQYYGVDIVAVLSENRYGSGKDDKYGKFVIDDIEVNRIIIGENTDAANISDKNTAAKISAIKNSIREVYNFDINNINVSIRG